MNAVQCCESGVVLEETVLNLIDSIVLQFSKEDVSEPPLYIPPSESLLSNIVSPSPIDTLLQTRACHRPWTDL